MSTKKQFQLTINEDQRDRLCELLNRELASWFEFYRHDLEDTIDLENYTCFQLLKQMDWPLEDEIEMINEAKQNVSALQKGEKLMTTNCYLLIGLPASGKTTASKKLAVAKKAVVISTDEIRKKLYGLETVQGEWKEIEAVLHEQILRNVSKGQSVIVDATHCRKAHRKVLLDLDERISWTGYYFRTKVDTCYVRNQRRSRSVPRHIIASMSADLRLEPPSKDEGFKQLLTVMEEN